MGQVFTRLNGLRTGGFSTFYYGWVIVGVAFVSMAFWLGIRTSFSVFYVALLEQTANRHQHKAYSTVPADEIFDSTI